jgi:hypothetical protein
MVLPPRDFSPLISFPPLEWLYKEKVPLLCCHVIHPSTHAEMTTTAGLQPDYSITIILLMFTKVDRAIVK